MFSALSLYRPVTNLGIIASNPEKPGPLIVTNNLEVIVSSQFFASNGYIKNVDISNVNGYVSIFSSMGTEIKRNVLRPFRNELRSVFALQPDRYTIRIVLQFIPTFILNLYNIQKIINMIGGDGYLLVFRSNDTFNVIKDMSILMNSSSSVTVRMIINFAEVSIIRSEIFDHYNNGNINKKYTIRLTYYYNCYGDIYKDLLFLIGSSSVQLSNSISSYPARLLTIMALSNADEKSTSDGKAYFNSFTVDSTMNIIPLLFIQGVVKITWYAEVRG